MTLIDYVAVVAVLIGIALIRANWMPKFEVHEGFAGLLYRFGKLVATLEPGSHQRFGKGFTLEQVDMRRMQLVVAGQEVLTADNVGIKLSVLLTFRYKDAAVVTHEVQNIRDVIYGAVQMASRDAVAELKAEALLENRTEIGTKLRTQVAGDLETVAVEVLALDVKDVVLPGDLRRAFNEVLKARNEGLATLERARSESAAMRNLANAARLLDNNPNLLKLRALQAMEAGGDKTVVMGSPLDLLTGVAKNDI